MILKHLTNSIDIIKRRGMLIQMLSNPKIQKGTTMILSLLLVAVFANHVAHS